MALQAPRIILYGHFGSGNIGNDSSLEAMLHAIKKYRPTADVLCLCNGPQVVKERYGIETMPIGAPHGMVAQSSSNRFLSILQKIWRRLYNEIEFWMRRPGWFQPGDQFIVVGTGAVDDMAVKHFWNAPYDLYKWCSVAKLGGARLVFLSVGVGPIKNRISRVLMLRALRMADYRSYREKFAFEYLRSVGYETAGDLLYPDLVFSLPEEELPASRKSAPAVVVGLGLINYSGWGHDPIQGEAIYQEYIAKMICFVGWLLERGHTIRIIIGDDVDARPVHDVLAHVAKEKTALRERVLLEKISDVRGLFHQIAQTDIVVASRFHNVLCSLMLERPVISLGYHAKNTDLMADMGLEAYCQFIEDFTMEKLIEQFESYLANMDQATQRIHQHQQQYRQRLDEQYRNVLRTEASN